ncbi:inactive rhomboid protein 1-like [Montipora capricornis]|uniref:inactive rhomboid protein 1-like n=1 Tax=Montipora capricornis TaxID=246305 RepID=UPI0035F1049D
MMFIADTRQNFTLEETGLRKSSFEQPGPRASSGFRPYFTCAVAMAQLSILILMCCVSTFAEIGLSPTVHRRIEPLTFRGNVTVVHIEHPNPLIGPTRKVLVAFGALFPLCVREDHALNVQQVQGLYPHLGQDGEELGCCEFRKLNIAGTATEVECHVLSNSRAKWRATKCSQRSSSQSSVLHVLRPCCGELNGQCTLTSPEHCLFMKGRFHLHAEHCTQINCLQELCFVESANDVPDEHVTEFSPRKPNQWWRFLTSIYLHQGVLDCLLITSFQIWVSWSQESSQGLLRMALLHHTSGVVGHLIGSLFTEPDSPQAGASPSVGGIIGLALVEHVIFWPSIKAPRRRLAMLMACLSLLFTVGTLPHINNFALIAGVLYGFLFALILWAPLVFKRKTMFFRLLFVFVCATVFLLSIVLFYGVQHLHIGFKLFFRYISCIPYVKGLCYQENSVSTEGK